METQIVNNDPHAHTLSPSPLPASSAQNSIINNNKKHGEVGSFSGAALPPPGPQTNTNRSPRTVFVAKRMPPDYMGDGMHCHLIYITNTLKQALLSLSLSFSTHALLEPQYTNPHKRPIPISILTQTAKGPQRDRDGKIREHTLLGDIDDFDEMDRIYGMPSAPAGESDDVEHDENLDETETDEERAKLEEMRRKEEEAREKQRLERKRWLNRLHIFQRYREVREEHALRNWKRHSFQWQKIEREISKNVSKDPAELLMARLGEYRERIEERDLIEEAIDLLEHRKVNFWAPGLRIGNDLLGLMVTIPQAGHRRYESILAVWINNI
jgi:hypothetical protein